MLGSVCILKTNYLTPFSLEIPPPTVDGNSREEDLVGRVAVLVEEGDGLVSKRVAG